MGFLVWEKSAVFKIFSKLIVLQMEKETFLIVYLPFGAIKIDSSKLGNTEVT